MKNKLTVEHLSPYLIYGLKCQLIAGDNYIEIEELHGIEFGFLNKEPLALFKEFGEWGIGNSIKPILRPLSDMDTQILINDLHSKMSDAILEWIDYFNSDSQNKEVAILTAPYPVIIWCFENHFDVFNLIKKGLAVDINTLKEK